LLRCGDRKMAIKIRCPHISAATSAVINDAIFFCKRSFYGPGYRSGQDRAVLYSPFIICIPNHLSRVNRTNQQFSI